MKALCQPVERLIDFLLPQRCTCCQERVDASHFLCPSCWQQIDFIGAIHCSCCSLPFSFSVEESTVCNDCAQRLFSFDHVISVALYTPFLKGLLLRFKNYDQLHLGRLFAHLLYKKSSTVLETADFLIPIPIHWTRRWHRQFNQSAVIALHLMPYLKQARIKYAPYLLKKVRRNDSQGRKNAKDRFENVKNVYAVPKAYKTYLKDRHVVLVDDVLTSGATAHACALELRRAGCKRIDVLTIARTPKNSG